MKILHINSMAGVADLLAHEMGDSLVLQSPNLDRFGFGKYYKKTHYIDEPNDLVQAAKDIENKFDFTIIHDNIEYLDDFPNAIPYFHGSKLRSMGEWDGFAFLSTPDLLEYCPKGIVMEAPIDLELFKNNNIKRHTEWYCITREYQYGEIRRKILEQYENAIIDNRNDMWVEYESVPLILNKVVNYIDCKYDYSKPEIKPLVYPSCTALQAMACGCKVWTHNQTLLPNSLLKVHDSKVVARKFENCLEARNYLKN